MNIVKQTFKRFHYPIDIILICLRWYLVYSLSLCNLEKMIQERGVFVRMRVRSHFYHELYLNHII